MNKEEYSRLFAKRFLAQETIYAKFFIYYNFIFEEEKIELEYQKAKKKILKHYDPRITLCLNQAIKRMRENLELFLKEKVEFIEQMIIGD